MIEDELTHQRVFLLLRNVSHVANDVLTGGGFDQLRIQAGGLLDEFDVPVGVVVARFVVGLDQDALHLVADGEGRHERT